jgi:hypothetical protein
MSGKTSYPTTNPTGKSPYPTTYPTHSATNFPSAMPTNCPSSFPSSFAPTTRPTLFPTTSPTNYIDFLQSQVNDLKLQLGDPTSLPTHVPVALKIPTTPPTMRVADNFEVPGYVLDAAVIDDVTAEECSLYCKVRLNECSDHAFAPFGSNEEGATTGTCSFESEEKKTAMTEVSILQRIDKPRSTVYHVVDKISRETCEAYCKAQRPKCIHIQFKPEDLLKGGLVGQCSLSKRAVSFPTPPLTVAPNQPAGNSLDDMISQLQSQVDSLSSDLNTPHPTEHPTALPTRNPTIDKAFTMLQAENKRLKSELQSQQLQAENTQLKAILQAQKLRAKTSLLSTLNQTPQISATTPAPTPSSWKLSSNLQNLLGTIRDHSSQNPTKTPSQPPTQPPPTALPTLRTASPTSLPTETLEDEIKEEAISDEAEQGNCDTQLQFISTFGYCKDAKPGAECIHCLQQHDADAMKKAKCDFSSILGFCGANLLNAPDLSGLCDRVQFGEWSLCSAWCGHGNRYRHRKQWDCSNPHQAPVPTTTKVTGKCTGTACPHHPKYRVVAVPPV